MHFLITLPLLLVGSSEKSPEPAPPTGPTFHQVALADLRLDGELPGHPSGVDWRIWKKLPYLMPRVVLDGEGEAYYDHPNWNPDSYQSLPGLALGDGFLVVRTPTAVDVSGTLYFPTTKWDGQVALRFEIGATEAPTGESTFERAQARHYQRLMTRALPGSAWFRHRLGDGAVQLPRNPARTDSDLEQSYGLLSGGRALSENLQLDRLIPAALDDGAETVAVADIEGITVREFDWKPLLGDADPELDPLARLVPADQHAVFFPSFAALVELVDEASELGAPLLTVFEERSQNAGTRTRYERQLCMELDAVARIFGPMAIKSVAITGSDPYLRTGSDVAVLFEVVDAELVMNFVRQRQQAAVAGLEPGSVEVEVGDVRIYGVQTPGRAISSYVAVVDDVVIVSNSLVQLSEVLAAGTGGAPSLAALDEYRFFRQRYVRGDESESALIIVPDGAIRRWCGPRWRIAASRRTRAAAVLADLTARYATGLVAQETLSELPSDERFVLGDLSLTADGVRSSIYGRLNYQTPIAELELERVSKGEAQLYERWRDGYQRNWSNFFDPIAVRLTVGEEALGFDLTVMPLIVGSDYREFSTIAGDSHLVPSSGDPHADALMHFVLAIDPESEMIRELGESLTGMMPQIGADVMNWLGGSMAIYLDPSDAVRDVLESEDRSEAMENLMVDINELPLVVHFEVKSPLRLAAFLAAIRAFSDQTTPGLLRWESVTSGELRYVRITEDQLVGASVYYGTSSRALIFSLNEEALQRALIRDAARRADPEAVVDEHSWLGESVALEVGMEGLRVWELLERDSLHDRLQRESWDNLPILNEWKRRYPDRDPVALHAELWGETLRCPGGGEYVWSASDRTMQSTVFGHPGTPLEGVDLPPVLADVTRLRFGLTFENDGLRSRVEIVR